jgi:hypothetical protein
MGRSAGECQGYCRHRIQQQAAMLGKGYTQQLTPEPWLGWCNAPLHRMTVGMTVDRLATQAVFSLF